MPGHDMIVEWSADDGAFVADVPELPGCMAHGRTREDAIANVQQAAALWIDTALEFGDPVPEDMTGHPAARSPLAVEGESGLRGDPDTDL